MNEYAVEGNYDLVIPPTRSLLGANERAGDSLMLETGVRKREPQRMHSKRENCAT